MATLHTFHSLLKPLWRLLFEQFGIGILHRLKDINSWNFSLPYNANILLSENTATEYTGDSV